ncbi:MAG: hypothetical protein U9R74_07250 [Pseudomonadota bacterium]|nr:hypothetical protein [Pseudomonadota bacterium]
MNEGTDTDLAGMLRTRFRQLWHRLTSPGPHSDAIPVWDLLERRYGEPRRRYHTLRHIGHCLDEMDPVISELQSPDVVELAVWFHDVIHEPGATDNEARSAELLRQVAGKHMAPGRIERVGELILATTHLETPRRHDARILSDIDLSSLGAPWQRFLDNSAALRAEQPDMSDADNRREKQRFLGGLVERDAIYYTATFRDRYESAARQNIQRYLELLRSA